MVPRRSAARILPEPGSSGDQAEVEPVAIELVEGGLLKHTERTEVHDIIER